MIKKLWNEIENNQNIRQNLSSLRREMKNSGGQSELSISIKGQEEKLISLLAHEDAKVRKNAALLMGELGNELFLEPLYQAYEKETQLFVKSSYLNAMLSFDYRDYMDKLRARIEKLSTAEVTTENRKHLAEEMRQLSKLVVTMDGVGFHKFTAYEATYDVILLTNRNFQQITLNQLRELCPQAKAKVFGAGVMARVTDLNWIQDIRTYEELLFMVKGLKTCPMNWEDGAKAVVESDLLSFLKMCHKGQEPFYFRIELKSRMDMDKKSAYTKKMAAEIEKLSGRKLINTTSNYEFEIRLIENKEGSFHVLVKLFTLRDHRFSYRRQAAPTSIRPVNAALTAALAKDYLKEDGRVLDPFCGVGTMLIERYKTVSADTSYGVDIQLDAIEKARENTEAAGQLIHYINRSFFDFKHEYLFDEIITDMPFLIGRKADEQIKKLYEDFFHKAPSILKTKGTMILYSHDRGLVKRLAQKAGFRIEKEWEISMREGTYVFVLTNTGLESHQPI